MLFENPTPIENFDIVTTNTATSFKVEIIRLNLFVSADIRISLFSENNNIIRCDYLTLSGDSYNNWSNNDEYIITYVANYYGFILKPNTSSSVVALEEVAANVITDNAINVVLPNAAPDTAPDTVIDTETVEVVTETVVDNSTSN